MIEHYPLTIPTDRTENLLARKKIVQRGYDDKRYAHLQWMMCKRNPIYFVSAFLYILETRTSRILPFIPHPTQQSVLLALEDAVGRRGVVIPKGRDEGISTTGMAFTLWRALFYERQTILLVSQKQELVYDRANMDALMSKIEFMLKRLPTWLVDPDYVYTELHMHFPLTDSTIDGVSSAAHTGTGRRKTFIWFDEFAKVDNAPQIFVDTASVTNSRFFCSTHYGRKTTFYSLTQDDTFVQVPVHWTNNPLHAKDKYRADPKWGYEWRSPWTDRMFNELAKNKAMYAQEVEIDPLKSDTQFFDPILVEDCLKLCVDPVKVGDIQVRGGQAVFVDNPDGKSKLWVDPRKQFPRYETFSAGADIAVGSGATPSCLTIVSCLTGRKVFEFASAGIPDYKFAELCLAVCRWFNNAYFVWERSGMAAQFTKVIVESGYSNIWWKKANEQSIRGKLSDTPGWQPTNTGKVEAGKAYAANLASGKFYNPSREAILELNDFVLTTMSTMQHAPSQTTENVADARENHGDRVIADMLANLGLEEKRQGVQEKPLSMYEDYERRIARLKPKANEDGAFDTGPVRGGAFQ